MPDSSASVETELILLQRENRRLSNNLSRIASLCKAPLDTPPGENLSALEKIIWDLWGTRRRKAAQYNLDHVWAYYDHANDAFIAIQELANAE